MGARLKLIHDNDKHNQYLLSMAKRKPNKIIISTFGVYCGITKDGVDVTKEYGYKCMTKTIIDCMIKNCSDITVLVGIAKYASCKGQFKCHDCEMKYVSTIIRYMNHVQHFPTIKWKYSLQSHIKAYLFYYGDASCGLVGGRNFTNSDFDDISITIKGETFNDIDNYINKALTEAHGFSADLSDSLYSICHKNGISLKALHDCIEKGSP